MRPSRQNASMRISARASSANTAMKPTSTRRMSASSLDSRSNTPWPSALEMASAARLSASWSGSWVPMGAQCNSSRAAGGRCYTTETIETPELLLGRDVHVAGAAHGADRPGMRRVFLQLAPQARDADVDRAVERLPLAVARHAEQLVARQHLVRVVDERLEQVELHRGDGDLAPLRVAQGARLEIEEAAADGNAEFRGPESVLFLDAAENTLQPRAQLARIERLGDVVVGADLKAGDAVDHVARAGDHDDADVVALAQIARQRQAVLARQPDVEQHHRRRRSLELRAHRGAARGQRDFVSMLPEIVSQ